MSKDLMVTLREALNDVFDHEYSDEPLVIGIHWDPISHVLSFEGHVDCLNLWLDVKRNGDVEAVVEFNRHPGGTEPQLLWSSKEA